ncbi:reverse transcriptase domain-containing protein [Tanacetum coccineum]
MMKRLDDFVRSKKDFVQTELPKGETGEHHRKSYFPPTRKDGRPFRNHQMTDQRRFGPQNNYKGRDNVVSYRVMDNRPPYPSPRVDYQARVAPVLTLDALTKHPKDILATKTQLRLAPLRPMINPQRGGNMDRFCDYHQEKGHHTNDCHHLRRQLEAALESGKLNHLIKDKKRKAREEIDKWMDTPITFPSISTEDVLDEPLIVEAEVAWYLVRRIYVDRGALMEVMFEHCFENLSPEIKPKLKETQTNLVGFIGEATKPLGKIELEVCFGSEGLCRRTTMKFTFIRAPSPYNVILGRTGLRALRAIPSTIHSMMKFPTLKGIATLVTSQCDGRDTSESDIPRPIGRYGWRTARDRIIEHKLNVNTSIELERQKRRVLAPEKSEVVARDFGEWVKAGIVRSVRYPTWISIPVLVKKCDGDWRMCIDFKNLNSACLKDFYPLPNIDYKVESVMGFKYKCFLDAYKGYHQIQMSREDEEKTAFYTNQGTYCYTKMPFRLKHVGATYQWLIDSTFQSQIGRNLEAYVDEMVIKSNDEKMLLADVAETFDNLRKINMKLNPKKCSFGVEEGKFLGYMVTSEGIHANPKKTMILADLQSPRTLKEMQSLAGKLAALNRFLAKSAEKSLSFFNTLNNIMKENKHEYKWTVEAEEAFQQMKKYVINLPSLTPSFPKETLYAYLAVSKEALSLSLVHMTRRLRRYFEAHLVKVITDQPIKQILKRGLRNLEKYDVELGAYNITFEPRNAVKGQVLADFITETSDGESPEKYFRTPKITLERDETEEWMLFTDEASSLNGFGVGLVLIGPSGVEHTYALRLTFDNTNNEAEYEALLAGIRIARRMNIQKLEAKVDSKLVANERGKHYSRGGRRKLDDPDHPMHGEGDMADGQEQSSQRASKNQPICNGEWGALQKWYLVPMLRCVGLLQANYVIREIHIGSCGMHSGPHVIVRKAMRFGLPRIIVTDNGTQFVNDPFKSWCTRLNIQQMNTAVTHPQANRLVKRANKSLMERIKTRLGREKVGWVDELPNVLWAHRTSIKMSNGETPFSLTYRNEAVIPAEIGMPTYRAMMIREGLNEEEIRLNLDLLTERRELAAIREANYKTKLEQYCNKKVHLTSFKPGEFVFWKNEASRVEDQGKLGPKWEGPYRVTEAYQNDSYKLETMEDKEVPRTWHAINLRKCYL